MNSRFDCLPTALPGVQVVTRKSRHDSRGFFCRLFCREELLEAGFHKRIAQINYTRTIAQGTIRGLHFQYPPHAEMRLVSCLRGEVFDVAVDLREESATFLHWHAEVLSASNGKSMLIPEGFAHGFQTLTTDCELFYLHTEPYVPAAAGAFHALDPAFDIRWPLAVTEMSDRDRSHAFIDGTFQGVQL